MTSTATSGHHESPASERFDQDARLRRLVLFEAVCRAGSIGRGAVAIGLTQPAVSAAIKKLETGFGATLVERGQGGCDPTPEGLLLHARVARMFRQLEAAVAAVAGAGRTRVDPAETVRRRLTDSQLRCHVAIARTGSAAEGARQLGISQPAVHRAARALEDAVGAPLYRRRLHNVSANAAGLELARRIVVAFGEIDQARADLATARGLAAGRIAVGILPLMPQRLLARSIGQLRDLHPDVTVTIREGAHARLIEDLRFGRLDIIVGALREPRLHGSVVEHELFADPYVVAVRRGHPLAARRPSTARDLASHGWVVPQQDMPRRRVVDRLLATLPRPPRVLVETSSLAMVMAMLEENDCIALLSKVHVLHGNYRDELVALDVPAPDVGRTVGYTTRADWQPTRAQQAFIEQLVAECRMDAPAGALRPAAPRRRPPARPGPAAARRPG